MHNPKFKVNTPRNKRIYDYRPLLMTLLLTSSNWLSALPLLAASPVPGTVIENQATGSFTDPNDNTEKQIESNTVQVEVAEVAGITISQAALPEEAPSGVSGAGGNQGDGDINPDDVVYFTYKITNVGNDPTQFFIPGAPSDITNGTLSGNIEIIEYDPDGEGATAATDLSSSPVSVPNSGISTGDNAALGLPNGSIPPEGTLTIRVPIKASSTLNDGDRVTVVMGDTGSNDNSADTQNQIYSAGTNDVYTQDNPNGTTGETDGTPVNGDATFHRQEASYTQEVTVTVATATIPPPGTCPANPIGLVDFGVTSFSVEQGDGKNVGDVIRYPSVGTVNGRTVDVLATVVDLTADDGNVYPLENHGIRIDQTTGQPTGLAVTTIADSPAGVTAIAQIRYDLVDSQTNAPISSSFEIEFADLDGKLKRIESVLVPLNDFESYFTSNPTNIQLSINGTNLLVRGGADQEAEDASGAIKFIYRNTSSFNIIYQKFEPSPEAEGSVEKAAFFPDLTLFTALGKCDRYDFADAPDTRSGTGTGNYETLQENSGPAHIIVDGLYLGSQLPDADNNGTPTANADGDDNSTSNVTFDDEDGVRLDTESLQGKTINAGSTVNLNITTAGSGKLNAWIDWNSDGDFTDDGEQIATDLTPNSNAISLSVNVPATATEGTTYARFRYSTQTGLAPTGIASDGEVEDYQIAIAQSNQLSGTLYEDNDGGDDFDPNEPRLPKDITLTLYNDANNNNTVDSGEQVATTTTDDNGDYIFSDVANGNYKIKVDINDTEISNGYTLGTPNDLEVTLAGSTLTDQNFGFDVQPGFCNIGGGTPDPNVNPYISSEVKRNVIATRDITDTLDDNWLAAATGGTSQGNVVQPWFGTTNSPGNLSNFTYIDPAISASTNTIVELVEVPINNIGECVGQTNNSSSNPVLGTGDTLQSSSPRPLSLYNTDNQPAFWNQTNVPPTSTDNTRFAVRFTFDSPVKSFGAWFGDLETRTQDGTPAVLRLLDASGNRIGNDIAIAPNQIYNGNNPDPEIVDQSQCGNSPGTDTGCGNQSTRWVGFIDNNAVPRVKQVLVIVGDDDFNDNGDTEILSFIGANVILGNPNVLLVKRITAVNGETTNRGTDLASYINDSNNPYDDNKIEGANPPDYPSSDTDKWPNTVEDTNSTFLIGAINGGVVKPEDELDYTVYFLSTGETQAENVLLCDRIPQNATFIPNSFNNDSEFPRDPAGLQSSDRGIALNIGGQKVSLTNVKDSDAGQYFPPGQDPTTEYPNINCGGANTNGAVVVNLEDLPNAAGSGTPPESYGFLRFRGRVK